MSNQFIDKIINTVLPQPQGYRLIIKVKYWKQHYKTPKEIESWIINQIIFYYKISSWNGRKFNIIAVYILWKDNICIGWPTVCVQYLDISTYIVNRYNSAALVCLLQSSTSVAINLCYCQFFLHLYLRSVIRGVGRVCVVGDIIGRYYYVLYIFLTTPWVNQH